MDKPPQQAFGPVINRIPDLMIHTTRYASKGVDRLATDIGVARSTLSRIINNEVNPSFLTIARITGALEEDLNRRIDPRDLIAEYGRFLTRYSCDLCGCRGCIPASATDEFGDRKQAFINVNPGAWVTSRFPKGFEAHLGGTNGN